MTQRPIAFFLFLFSFALAFGMGCGSAVADETSGEIPKKSRDSDKQKAKKSDRVRRGGDHLRAFRQADTNQDGFLTVEEFENMQRLARLESEKRKRLFAFLDKNKDGKLHHKELHPATPPHFGMVLNHFARLDTDGSGSLSLNELSKAPLFAKTPADQLARLFAKMDRNKNGQLEKSDLMIHGHRDRPAIQFGQHDKDNSGGLSFEEYSTIPFMDRVPEQRRKKIFERIDANKDQQLSPEEIRKAKPPRPHRDHQRGPGGPKQDGTRRISDIS